jgi:hypothetical protein
MSNCPDSSALSLQSKDVLIDRQELLATLDAIAALYLKKLQDQGKDLLNFNSYAAFFNWTVFNLIGWDKICFSDLEKIPSARRLFFTAFRTARYYIKDKEDFLSKKRWRISIMT